jgi:hypothetical protein
VSPAPGSSAPGEAIQLRADLADLAALIERASADLALGEEPSNFPAALEGAGDER